MRGSEGGGRMRGVLRSRVLLGPLRSSSVLCTRVGVAPSRHLLHIAAQGRLFQNCLSGQGDFYVPWPGPTPRVVVPGDVEVPLARAIQ